MITKDGYWVEVRITKGLAGDEVWKSITTLNISEHPDFTFDEQGKVSEVARREIRRIVKAHKLKQNRKGATATPTAPDAKEN